LGADGYGTATGDFNHDGKPDLAVASSDVIFVLTNRASGYRYQTTVGVSPSRNPAMLGQTITFTATVTPAFSAGAVTGTVTFYDGANVLASKSLVNGNATFSTSSLALGTHGITAAYSGNSSYVPGKSSPLRETVTLRTTKTTVKSSLNPALVGNAVTLTATGDLAGWTSSRREPCDFRRRWCGHGIGHSHQWCGYTPYLILDNRASLDHSELPRCD